MADATALSDIESIKQLKARYCRHLDAKDWSAWRELFADDFALEIAGAGGRGFTGADEFVSYTRATLGKRWQPTVHHVHAPEISLTSPTTADGVWALHDVVRLLPALTLSGYGHYRETYEKSDGRWRLTSSQLTRLREDLVTPVLTLHDARRLRAAAAKLARRLGSD
jgi:SnoaL-like domain